MMQSSWPIFSMNLHTKKIMQQIINMSMMNVTCTLYICNSFIKKIQDMKNIFHYIHASFMFSIIKKFMDRMSLFLF
jgi:hypothetical protein